MHRVRTERQRDRAEGDFFAKMVSVVQKGGEEGRRIDMSENGSRHGRHMTSQRNATSAKNHQGKENIWEFVRALGEEKEQ